MRPLLSFDDTSLKLEFQTIQIRSRCLQCLRELSAYIFWLFYHFGEQSELRFYQEIRIFQKQKENKEIHNFVFITKPNSV